MEKEFKKVKNKVKLLLNKKIKVDFEDILGSRYWSSTNDYEKMTILILLNNQNFFKDKDFPVVKKYILNFVNNKLINFDETILKNGDHFNLVYIIDGYLENFNEIVQTITKFKSEILNANLCQDIKNIFLKFDKNSKSGIHKIKSDLLTNNLNLLLRDYPNTYPSEAKKAQNIAPEFNLILERLDYLYKKDKKIIL